MLYHSRKLSRLLFLLDEVVEKGDRVALKLHFGEPGNTRVVRPKQVREVAERVKKLGGDPFATDTTVLYPSRREHASSYLEVAEENGFSEQKIGCRVEIADGENGDKGRNISGFLVAEKILDADALVVLTHCTGHVSAAYGGALKNVAMGCLAKKGKRKIHDMALPKIGENCAGCGVCVENCPSGFIRIEKQKAVIDYSKCYSCFRCMRSCPNNVISGNPSELLKALARGANAALKKFSKKQVFYNFLENVTEYCDCGSRPGKTLAKDKGILASKDPVAVDASSINLIGRDKLSGFLDPWTQIEEAKRLKMGTTSHEVEEL